MPHCASGQACTVPRRAVPSTNLCSRCGNCLHSGCGVENPATGADELCYPCFQQQMDIDYSNEGDGDDNPLTIKRRKSADKGGLHALFSNFQQLDHKFVSAATGIEQTHWACICIHCKKAYESAIPGQFPQVKCPSEFARYRSSCEAHLVKCQYYQNSKDVAQGGGGGGRDVPRIKVTSPTAKKPRAAPKAMTSAIGGAHQMGDVVFVPGSYRKKPTVESVKDQQNRDELLIEMIVDCDMPFGITESASFRRLVDILYPSASYQLPSQEQVDELLKRSADKAKVDIQKDIEKALSRGHRAGMIVVTGKNGNKVVTESLQLSLGDQSFALAYTVADCGRRGVQIAHAWERQLTDSSETYAFHYFCAADAGLCGRARRILAFRYPFMVWTSCWAHQINLIVKILLELPQFKQIFEQAVEAAKAIHSSSNSVWLAKIRDLCNEMYGPNVPNRIAMARATAWSSTQRCFASQLRIEDACKNFAFVYGDTLPTELGVVWKDDDYWQKLAQAELLIRPFCEASHLMRREGNTMAHVMLILLNLYKHASEHCGDWDDTTPLLADMERRWKQVDNPLFFLAFALHPAYRATAVQLLAKSESINGNWSDDRNYLSVARLVEAAKFYFMKFELHDTDADASKKKQSLDRLGKSIKKWLHEDSLDVDPYESGENVVEYWNLQKAEFPQISTLAMFLLDAPVQTASCDLMIENFFKTRTSVDPETMYRMAQVKYNVRRKYSKDSPKVEAATELNISAEQHQRTPDSPDGSVAQAAALVKGSVSEELEEDLDYEVETERGGPLHFWIDLLSTVVSEDDDDFLETEQAQGKSYASGGDDDSDDDVACFEKRHTDLPDLREQNDEKCPQENAGFFSLKKSKKQYVRTDKYALSRLCGMLSGESNLPAIKSAYE